jgi:DNA-binding NtrC family response regulator
MLDRAGFTVLMAEDGRKGVEVFRKHAEDIRLVLLDLTMPHLSGEEAYREIKQIRPDVQVILISGFNQQEALDHFTGKGLAGFIQKPFRFQSLISKLREVLE